MKKLHDVETILDDGDELPQLALHQPSPPDVFNLGRGANFKENEALEGSKKVLFREGSGAAFQQLVAAISTRKNIFKRLEREALVGVEHFLCHDAERSLRHVERRVLQRRHRSDDVHKRAVASVVSAPPAPF